MARLCALIYSWLLDMSHRLRLFLVSRELQLESDVSELSGYGKKETVRKEASLRLFPDPQSSLSFLGLLRRQPIVGYL